MTDLAGYDVERLARTLRGQLRGTVSTGGGDRALYTADASKVFVPGDKVSVPVGLAEQVAGGGAPHIQRPPPHLDGGRYCDSAVRR